MQCIDLFSKRIRVKSKKHRKAVFEESNKTPLKPVITSMNGKRLSLIKQKGRVGKSSSKTLKKSYTILMVANNAKYQQALVFFLTHCNNIHLGITKLNKLFYYLDFISYRDQGKSVTGETYVRLPKGPVAKTLESKQIDNAMNSGLISHTETTSEKYGIRHVYKPLVKPDMTVFNEYEQELLKSVCAYFAEWPTNKMIAQTHTEAPWVFSTPSKELDYSLANDIEILSQEEVTA